MAIVIEIEKAGGTGPASGFDASLGGDVSESAVAIVVIQRVLSVVGYVDVGKTVVIVIAYGYADAVVSVSSVGETGFLGDIGESTIGILAVQAIPILRVVAIEFLRQVMGFDEIAAIHQENIEEAVVVVIKQGDAATHGFDQIFLGRGGIAVLENRGRGEFDVEHRSGLLVKMVEGEGENEAHRGQGFEEVTA